ncbi:MAG: hypothetical protein ACLQMF_02960 [Rectinemataceae bacterium]
MPPSASTAPTERSNPPVISIMVMAIAMIASVAKPMAMAVMLSTFRK